MESAADVRREIMINQLMQRAITNVRRGTVGHDATPMAATAAAMTAAGLVANAKPTHAADAWESEAAKDDGIFGWLWGR